MVVWVQSVVPAGVITTAFPDGSTTGPVRGTVFTTTSGQIQTTADNQVIENLFLNPGQILIKHFNCIVRNCIINATGTNQVQGGAITDLDNGTNYNGKVFNCKIYTIVGTNKNLTGCDDGIRDMMEVGYCDISGVSNAINIGWPIYGAAYLHDNFIHDFCCWDTVQDPPDGSHCDGLQTFDISNSGGMTVSHNTVLGWQTTGTFVPTPNGSSSCLAFITGQFNLTLYNNLFAGGSYCLYGPSQNAGGGHPVNVHVINNRFSTKYFPNGGNFGTHAGWDNTAAGFIWSGNQWYDGPNQGQTVDVLPWPN